jgi:phosphoenolpyruvate carboxykinase (GTP)
VPVWEDARAAKGICKTLRANPTALAACAGRDPMAMLPFIGYHAGDYFDHWVTMGKQGDELKLPKIFQVNWFRRDEDGSFLWPGFGDNSRVLKWVVERVEGTADAVDTPIGLVPTPDSVDTEGLDLTPEQLERVLAVNVDEWRNEVTDIQEWFAKIGSDRVPANLMTQLDELSSRLI